MAGDEWCEGCSLAPSDTEWAVIPPDGGAAEWDLQTRSREDDLQLFNLSRLAAQSKHGLPARLPLVSRLSPPPLQRDGGEVLHSDSLAGGNLYECSPAAFSSNGRPCGTVPPACQGARHPHGGRAPRFFSCIINGPYVSFAWPRPGVHVYVHSKMNSSARGLNCSSFSSSPSSSCRIASLAQASSFLQPSWDFSSSLFVFLPMQHKAKPAAGTLHIAVVFIFTLPWVSHQRGPAAEIWWNIAKDILVLVALAQNERRWCQNIKGPASEE